MPCTNAITGPAADLRVSVYFPDPRLFQGLLLYGHEIADVRQDWRDMLQCDGDAVYRPAGPMDADYGAEIFTGEGGGWYGNLISRDFEV